MDSIKVKNFIIIVLLIVNAILLAVFITDYARENALEESTVEGALALLGENGISVAGDVDLSERQIEALSISRDNARELDMVEGLLGSVTTSDPGGNIMLYFGSSGEARFSGTGGVEINLRAGSYSTTDPVAAARRFASELGMDTMREPISSDIDSEKLEGTLVLGCTVDGVRVVNCNLSFTFANGELMAVYGTRVLDTVTQGSVRSAVDVPTVAHALPGAGARRRPHLLKPERAGFVLQHALQCGGRGRAYTGLAQLRPTPASTTSTP